MYPNVKHPRVFWIKKYANLLGFDASFAKDQLWWGWGVKEEC